MFERLNHAHTHTYTARIPGKLFVAGEYAILEAGNPAILFAVNQYLSCRVATNSVANTIELSSDLPELTPLQFKRNEPIPTHAQWRYVLSAIQVVEDLITTWQQPLRCYQLHFATELIDEHGAKYGFGSSGAVTVATIKALFYFYGIEIQSPETLFKLAAIALTRMGTTGSLADIAVNCYGGWVFYRSLDRQWLAKQLASHVPIETLLTCAWPRLTIESLATPTNLQIHIGWTTSPASTDQHVQSFHTQKEKHPALYQQFIKDSADAVHRMKSAFDQQDVAQLQQALTDARHLLLTLDQAYNLSIETPALKHLINLAEQHGFVAKSSGAGGGDCGIAFGYQSQNNAPLLQAWREAGIIPLSLGIAPSQINE
ncbi:phosphomevalonate kinase [Aerococcaceae bacterium NML160702]|nr:phosphomevalonate kinase [Aerococcaceae bacterium NML130460]MCW6682333.1 phosphomevalonate kinase [Aerococcaceae bacterium NML160702]